MKKESEARAHRAGDEEPMGIVISRGRERAQAPVFTAYMYAPDPEHEELPLAAAPA